MSALLAIIIATPALDAAEAALADFDAQLALTRLETATSSGPLSLEDHIRLHAGRGIALAYLERNEESLAAFSKLLTLAPGHAIPYTLSPRVTFLFEEARKKARPPAIVDLSWPRDLRVDDELPVVVEVIGASELNQAKARLHFRDEQTGIFEHVPVELPAPGDYVTVSLPAYGPEVTSDRVRQIYLSVFDPNGNEILRVGNEDRPREVRMRYEAPTRWYERWWIWAAAGTLVAAGASSAVYLATRPEPTDVPFDFRVTP